MSQVPGSTIDFSTLTFEALLGSEPVYDTLAYWLGVTSLDDFSDLEPDAVASSMGYQYDIEEQAGQIGHVFPGDADWREFFQPVAPVQLALRWSPVPLARRLLEQVTTVRISNDQSVNRAALVLWGSDAVAAANQATSSVSLAGDERRFVSLFDVAIMRAQERGQGVLLVAKPGWSYGHGWEFDPATREMMSKAGFAVTDRRMA